MVVHDVSVFEALQKLYLKGLLSKDDFCECHHRPGLYHLEWKVLKQRMFLLHPFHTVPRDPDPDPGTLSDLKDSLCPDPPPRVLGLATRDTRTSGPDSCMTGISL